jgi:ElaA protein
MIVRAARFADLDAATLYSLLKLRVDVFVVEQACAYPELDDRDTEPGTVHVWLDDGGRPVAYLRVLTDPDAARIGRVCTRADRRGRGLSGRLMAAVLDRLGGRPCVLDAQSYLAGWYARFGFTATGPEYVEDGIPHTPMRREPGPADATAAPPRSPRPTAGGR